MAARGPRPAVLLLLAACLALASGNLWNTLHDLFRKNHMDMPKTEAINDNTYCNKMMWQRRIYWKSSNTFIHGPVPGPSISPVAVRQISIENTEILDDFDLSDAASSVPPDTTAFTTPTDVVTPDMSTTPSTTTSIPGIDTDFDINSICTTGGTATGLDTKVSNKPFKITVCTFNPWSLSYTGVSSTAKIVISCLHGLAVLFVKSVSA